MASQRSVRSGIADLFNGSAWAFALRLDPFPGYGQPRERNPPRQTPIEHDHGEAPARAFPGLRRLADSKGASAQAPRGVTSLLVEWKSQINRLERSHDRSGARQTPARPKYPRAPDKDS